MTTKLYDLNCSLQNFDATVLACEAGDGVFKVVLDQTAFFPEGGGQPSDTGTLNGVAVLDVQETPEGIIHNTSESIPAGTRVHGQIDWDKRFHRMQNHTGEHILSGIIFRLFGFNNVGFHIGSDSVTVDFDGFLTKENLDKIELEANEIVVKNAAVTVAYPPAELLAGLQYRSKINLTEGVRIVTVEGCDACACCAPHVASTGQIGIIKLLDAVRYKGGVRISMLCGFDALADYNEKCKSVAAVSALLSAKQKDITAAVERTKEELAAAQRRHTEIKQRLIEMTLESMRAGNATTCVFEPLFDMADLRRLATAGLDFCTGVFAAFSGSDQDGYQFVICSNTVDLRERAKEINQAINGRGGGTSAMLQGGASASREKIEEYFTNFN